MDSHNLEIRRTLRHTRGSGGKFEIASKGGLSDGTWVHVVGQEARGSIGQPETCLEQRRCASRATRTLRATASRSWSERSANACYNDMFTRASATCHNAGCFGPRSCSVRAGVSGGRRLESVSPLESISWRPTPLRCLTTSIQDMVVVKPCYLRGGKTQHFCRDVIPRSNQGWRTNTSKAELKCSPLVELGTKMITGWLTPSMAFSAAASGRQDRSSGVLSASLSGQRFSLLKPTLRSCSPNKGAPAIRVSKCLSRTMHQMLIITLRLTAGRDSHHTKEQYNADFFVTSAQRQADRVVIVTSIWSELCLLAKLILKSREFRRHHPIHGPSRISTCAASLAGKGDLSTMGSNAAKL